MYMVYTNYNILYSASFFYILKLSHIELRNCFSWIQFIENGVLCDVCDVYEFLINLLPTVMCTFKEKYDHIHDDITY